MYQTLIDQQHIWHPYSGIYPKLENYCVSEARNSQLFLEDGTVLIDGMSSWWCVIHGYNHPALNQAIVNQLEKFAHIMFGGLTHPAAIKLTERLLSIVPKGLTHVFYSDSGSVSIEVAMKMALQYQQKHPDKKHFGTIKGGYHGDTWHPMSVCDPDTGMHHLYQGRLPIQYFLDRPTSCFHEPLNQQDKAAIDHFFQTYHSQLAAFILEPIVQGAGGMWFYSPQYLQYIAQQCQQYNVLLIVDEIATGFGRTGKWFACEHSDIVPDIMCIGKALTGGYLSFAATLCSHQIADTISQTPPYALMHGPTFMGNALACAVAAASIDLLQNTDWQSKVNHIETIFKQELSVLKHKPYIQDIRALGAIGVIELKEPVTLHDITPMFIQKGVWVRPFGKLVYLMPNYNISDRDLKTLCQATCEVVRNYHER
ncbi:adenosylmethionine--8-amino-7-oxononanoate transaminase [Basilea psittacipulmonis]|uniref:Adenosylmethionine-8-amino-7-oxononanoate aminotransferase n=1 Tax=Basilea psittacipulmonis DSM 24701 TaxID=1072685 RepID=A0A077DBW9_9BURK|nr:adenosylmethionine--8-amino-7-oxononanoate transaminase [Basilea psittacipulmonis]AIL32154.1 adenosylmethionine-8-amino-7-oxononanoate aminotransferase [Basilea psittacipulmonis DSM 24701]